MFLMRKSERGVLATTPSAVLEGIGGPITVVGEIVCLPHKGQGIVETKECGLGVRGAGSVYYGLLDTTPGSSFASKLENGKTVSISGTLRDAPVNNVYVNVGVIEIQTVESVGENNKL